jgi:hypothetical protein
MHRRKPEERVLNRIYDIFRNRNLQVIIATFYAAFLTAVIAYLLHEFHLKPIPLIVIEVFLAGTLALLVERATSSARGIAFLIANDLRFSMVASALLFTAGLLAYFHEPRIVVRTPQSVPLLASQALYIGAGLLLGTNLRLLVTDLVTRALFGRPRFFASLCLISLWFLIAAIALLPVHPNAMMPFLVGLGVGIFLHKGLTLRLTRGVAAYRRLFEVQSNLPETLPLPENERKALSLLAAGRHPLTKRFSALRTHLDCQERRTMSKRLHLLSACAWRLEGRYTDAIDDTKMAANPPIDNLDAQLLLIRALSLEDHDDATDDEIDDILSTLTSTPPGEACPLTRALLARRAAERSIDARGIITFSRDPLVSVVASIDLRRNAGPVLERTQAGIADEATAFFRGIVAHGVPVTPSWLLDVFGYSLLVAGCPEEARVFLQRCISLDPDYSYGYLHLGDCFLFRNTGAALGGTQAAPGKTSSWHARTCYLLAERIERSRASRVRRIARGRLELLARLNQPPIAVRANA